MTSETLSSITLSEERTRATGSSSMMWQTLYAVKLGERDPMDAEELIAFHADRLSRCEDPVLMNQVTVAKRYIEDNGLGVQLPQETVLRSSGLSEEEIAELMYFDARG